MLIGQPLAGRVCDLVGDKRTTVTSLLGFAVFSAAGAVAPSFVWLVVARGLQAVFASALAPSVQSMLRAVTGPGERGHVFGILSSVIGVGAASGPLVGGALLTAFNWRAIFLVNLPVVAIALFVLVRVNIPQPRSRRGHRRDTQTAPAASDPPPTASVLRQPTFVAAFATQGLSNLAQYSLLLIAPIVLDRRSWSSGEIGLALSALTFGLIAMGPAGGRRGDRSGRRLPVAAGLVTGGVAICALVPFGADASPVLLITVLALFGMGMGFASPGITTAALESVPADRTGSAAGLLSMSRYIGSVIGSLVLATFVSDDGAGIAAMYAVAAAAVGLALLATRGLPGKAETPARTAVR
jgi:DHA2 family methylenomycin A resistance protein-like MFS transporter